MSKNFHQLERYSDQLIATSRSEVAVQIRVTTESDLPALEEKVHRAFGRSFQQELIDQSKGELTLLSAWIDSSIVGAGFIRWRGPREETVRQTYPDVPEIYRLSIFPKYRSQGIGRALFLKFEKEAVRRDIHTLGLGVAYNNLKAFGFYQHMGYKESAINEYYDEYLAQSKENVVVKVRNRCHFLIKTLSPFDITSHLNC